MRAHAEMRGRRRSSRIGGGRMATRFRSAEGRYPDDIAAPARLHAGSQLNRASIRAASSSSELLARREECSPLRHRAERTCQRSMRVWDSILKRSAAPNDPMEPSRSRGFQTHTATDVRSRDNGSIVRRRYPRWTRPLGAPRLRAPGGEPHLCLQRSAIGRRHTSAWTKRSGGMCQRIAVHDVRLPGIARIGIGDRWIRCSRR